MFTIIMSVIASQCRQQSDITRAGNYPSRFRTESWCMWRRGNTYCTV